MRRFLFLTFVWLLSKHALAHDTNFRCVFTVDKKELDIVLSRESADQASGKWLLKKELRSLDAARVCPSIPRSRDIFELTTPGEQLLKSCYRAFRDTHSSERLYFARLKTILAFRADDARCHGHPIVVENANDFAEKADYGPALPGRLIPLGRDSTTALRKRLKAYNFAPVLEGLVYRSGALGKAGIANVFAVFESEGLQLPRSIASIHVMGYGGEGGTYNLEELAESQARGLSFLYSYARDKKLMVYMDGTDPSEVPDDDHEHGNIFREKTLAKYVPDAAVRTQLGIDLSLEEGRHIVGNTADFLLSLENIIDAPWPIIIHCKGGRHKTGMFCIMLEYLAYKIAMSPSEEQAVLIPAYQNRFARWWVRQGNFFDIFFGGPLFENVALRPAERHYAEHNRSVFRRKNIDFVRRLVDGTILTSDELKTSWKRIEEKFRSKVKDQAYYLDF